MSGFLTLLKRDLLLALREGGALGTALGFYLIVVTLMPLGLGPDLNLLTRIAPGILWVALLLAALLSLPRLFEADHDDGSLDVLALGHMPLELVAASKALAHWISTGIPLALMAPILGILLNLEARAYPLVIATMLAGTPAISFLGAIGAALTLKTRRGGLLLALIFQLAQIGDLAHGRLCIGRNFHQVETDVFGHAERFVDFDDALVVAFFVDELDPRNADFAVGARSFLDRCGGFEWSANGRCLLLQLTLNRLCAGHSRTQGAQCGGSAGRVNSIVCSRNHYFGPGCARNTALHRRERTCDRAQREAFA